MRWTVGLGLLPGLFALAAQAAAVELIALSEQNRLLRFEASQPGKAVEIGLQGLQGRLVGIDTRPADGRLYGLTDTGALYTIDPRSGQATRVSTLNQSYGSPPTGFDFNPTSDRLRLVASDGRNLRVQVEIGAVGIDRPLAFAPQDRHAGKQPQVNAVAYTNAVAGAANTKTFDIDSNLDVLLLQEPPNDGVLSTVGPLGIDFGPMVGFDIVTDAGGTNQAFAVSGATLYTIDLATGRARRVGEVGSRRLSLMGLAVLAPLKE